MTCAFYIWCFSGYTEEEYDVEFLKSGVIIHYAN